MLVILLLLGGIASDLDYTGRDCIETLHELRTEARLDIVSTDVLEDNVMAFTLTDGPRRSAKTAFLVCERSLEEVDDSDMVDQTAVEEGLETMEPVEEAADLEEATEVVEETPSEEPAAQ